jgi:hypothetical protein
VSVGLVTIDLGHKRLDVREIMHAHSDEAAGLARLLRQQAGPAPGACQPDRLSPARIVALRPPWDVPTLCRRSPTG